MEETPKKRGRKKTKEQQSVRIDQVLMDWAHDAIAARPKEKIRFVDLMERGLIKVLREMGVKVDLTGNPRLFVDDVLSREGPAFARLVLNRWALEQLAKSNKLDENGRILYDFIRRAEDAVSQWPGYQDALRAE